MRKFLISAAVAASALTAAAPAAAQWFPPQQQGYYPQPQGHGYQHNYGQIRRLQARIDQLQHQINRLDRRNILSEREAERLRHQARELEMRLRYAVRNGLHPQERHMIEQRIARLEHRLWRDARDGNRYGYNDGRNWSDRDRDGRPDRFEDDRGRDHDGRRDRGDDDDD